jgi:toxin YoeB
MEIEFTAKAETQLNFWKRSGNVAVLKKIRALIASIIESPFNGIGKPEQLKHELSGYWSRRITDEHRLVYQIDNNKIIIIQCRFHYND